MTNKEADKLRGVMMEVEEVKEIMAKNLRKFGFPMLVRLLWHFHENSYYRIHNSHQRALILQRKR